MSEYALQKFKPTNLNCRKAACEVLCRVSLPSESAHTGHKCKVQSSIAQHVHPIIDRK